MISQEFCGYYLIKLTVEAVVIQTRNSNVFILLHSCALGPATSLSIMAKAHLLCLVNGCGARLCRPYFHDKLLFYPYVDIPFK